MLTITSQPQNIIYITLHAAAGSRTLVFCLVDRHLTVGPQLQRDIYITLLLMRQQGVEPWSPHWQWSILPLEHNRS